jgi:predicted DNA-binding transcriptional regulator AlpA
MKLWTKEQVADFLQLSPRTVAEKYQIREDFPKPFRCPRLRWDADEIERWVKKQRQNH